MSDIFDNAIDSVEFGVSLFLTEQSKARKHAILTIYQAIELLLKERLHREHPLLIFKNLDRAVGDDAPTVGLDEILKRFSNLGITLFREEVGNLKQFRRRRNQIQHYRYDPRVDDVATVGQALKFVYDFLPDHLDTRLEDHLDEEPFSRMREMIHDYEELLAEAELRVAELRGVAFKDDPSRMTPCRCPECGTGTLVIGTDRGDFCFLCRQEFSMEMCEMCCEYVSSNELDDSTICSECWGSRSRKD